MVQDGLTFSRTRLDYAFTVELIDPYIATKLSVNNLNTSIYSRQNDLKLVWSLWLRFIGHVSLSFVLFHSYVVILNIRTPVFAIFLGL